jgi:hypothetical protein
MVVGGGKSTAHGGGVRNANCSMFAWLIIHQSTVLFSHNKPATSNQLAVLFSQNKSAPAISHQPNEQAVSVGIAAPGY